MSSLVIAQSAGAVAPATLRAVSAAQAFGQPVELLVFGPAQAVAAHAAIAGLVRVLSVEGAHFEDPLAEDAARAVSQLAKDYRVVLAAHDSFARNVLPRVAALAGVGMVSDVLAIEGEGRYLRPIYAGNLLARVDNRAGLQVLTVRASRFEPAALGGACPCVSLPALAADGRIERRARSGQSGEFPDLKNARVVVSGGRSLGSAEKFTATLAPLARQLGAALGATRAAADAGFAPNEWQVGQTGTTVAPELYIAVGLSGAQQHLAGMKDSKVIVAINQDAEAPIMKVADYALVADLFDAVPALAAELSKQGH